MLILLVYDVTDTSFDSLFGDTFFFVRFSQCLFFAFGNYNVLWSRGRECNKPKRCLRLLSFVWHLLPCFQRVRFKRRKFYSFLQHTKPFLNKICNKRNPFEARVSLRTNLSDDKWYEKQLQFFLLIYWGVEESFLCKFLHSLSFRVILAV